MHARAARSRPAIPPALVALLTPLTLGMLTLGMLALTGCAGPAGGSAGSSVHSTAGSTAPTPALGGPPPVRATPPPHAMDRFERPVAARLASRVATQGLTLDYLDCPRWDGRVPRRLTCRGYLDGLRVGVEVALGRATDGRAVGFDARLARGVIATRELERTLARGGDADCGPTPAYAAEPGSRIVCRVTRGDRPHYLVATVRDRAGAVRIADYRDLPAAR